MKNKFKPVIERMALDNFDRVSNPVPYFDKEILEVTKPSRASRKQHEKDEQRRRRRYDDDYDD